MNRKTPTYWYDGSVRMLGDILDTYGAKFVSTHSGARNLFVFATHARITTEVPKHFMLASALVLKGRPIHHVSKSTGKLKKSCNGPLRRVLYRELQEIRHSCPMEVCSAAARIQKQYKQRHVHRVSSLKIVQRAVKKWVTKRFTQQAENLDIDIQIDPITCEPIKVPVVIVPDWNAGNKVIYDITTVAKFQEYETIPAYYLDDILYSYQAAITDPKTGNAMYVSPMTRTKFDYTAVRYVGESLWYKILTEKIHGNAVSNATGGGNAI